MSLLGWLVIGVIAGWLSGTILKGYGLGVFGNLIVGIVGACIGGYLLPRLGIFPESTEGNLIAATLGALILLVILGLLKRP